MRQLSFLCLLLSLQSFVQAQTRVTVTDIEGRTYKTAKLGTQTWMAENLSVTRFRNGDNIPQATTKEAWLRADLEGEPAWCYYNNDSSNAAAYGLLYNWYAVTDPRGLAPAKWHVPNQEEWSRLINYLGGKGEAGAKLKDSSGWNNGGNGSNASGFAALPGGSRTESAQFIGMARYGYWWSAQEQSSRNGWGIDMGFGYRHVNLVPFAKGSGFAVRCVRD
ncbi:MAG TPA: fibrobacter succinogenes major paralogous domain-containing protein [Lacibacter sp.]|nr:fibrobacter succinogenes major paralogous domain-containing protein [Lacibacter sp.]HMO87745.1 fibrobacter succinogenes major paralogous domain-containing protein [Lacibacter sp.]HMP85673.1 fibrobacter succinogenes major paralogous domain-containing protein [Lacibacter sp.]